MYPYVSVCLCVYVCVCVCISMCVCVCMSGCMCVCVRVSVCFIYTCNHMDMFLCAYTIISCMCIFMCVCIYVNMCVHIYVCGLHIVKMSSDAPSLYFVRASRYIQDARQAIREGKAPLIYINQVLTRASWFHNLDVHILHGAGDTCRLMLSRHTIGICVGQKNGMM